MISDQKIFQVLPDLQQFVQSMPIKSKLGFDEIFMVNLERRPDRYERMKYNFDQLGIDYKWVPAMDGRKITEEFLAETEIKMLRVLDFARRLLPIEISSTFCGAHAVPRGCKNSP